MYLLQVLDVATFHKQNDFVSLLEDMKHPTAETRFKPNSHLDYKLSNLDRWDSLRSDSYSKEVKPSFHLQQMNQPFVD